MRTAMIRARVEPRTKAAAERIFHKLGMTATEAIHIFYRQVELGGGLPFPVKIPNDVTRRTFEKTDAGRSMKSFSAKQGLFKELGLR